MKKALKEVFSTILYILVVLLGTWLIITFVGQRTSVSGSSMEPTLHHGDQLIMDKLTYHFSEPERFDIIVFPFRYEENTYYVKRIIGLPGETVTIVDGKVYIDGSEEPLDEPYLPEPMEGSFGPYVVPEGAYFMMGDNRNHSQDARYWTNTFVYEDQMVAKVIFSYFPTVKMIDGVYFD